MVLLEELMINNWVLCFNPNKPGYPRELPCRITWRHLRLLTEEKNNNDYDPIPLTIDLLKAAGFQNYKQPVKEFPDVVYEDWRIGNFVVIPIGKNKDKFEVEWVPNSFSIDERSHIGNCQTLHRLQNLYYMLVNEELKIEL